MVDPIVNRAAQPAAEQGAQQGPQHQRQVSSEEQTQFEDALNRPADGTEGQSAEVTQTQAGDAATGQSYGDALVQQIQDVKQNYDVQSQRIQDELGKAAEGGDLSPADLLKAQLDVAKMTMEMDLVAKGGDKVSTDVQTLMNRSN